MTTGLEPDWHQASGHHAPSFSMGGGHFGNNNSPHAYVPFNQPTMTENPSTPSAYMHHLVKVIPFGVEQR